MCSGIGICRHNRWIFVRGVDGAVTWKLDCAGVLYLTGNGDYEGIYLEKDRETVPQWSVDEVCLKIKKAVVNVTGITSLRNFFYNCQYMESVDLSGLDTSNTTNMATMFGKCCSLKSVDLSKLDISKVTTMAGMFSTCVNLLQIDISNFDTRNVTKMKYMFDFCKKLQAVDFSNKDLSKVEEIDTMFQCCYALKKADFSGTSLLSLTDTSVMFNQCKELESIDVSGFETSKVTDMCYMFAQCHLLKEIDVSNFNTSNVKDMDAMFMGCAMSELDISMFDMSNCKKVTAMFKNCTALKEVNLPDSMTEIDARTFYNCSILEYLYIPQALTVIGENAFYGCDAYYTKWHQGLHNVITAQKILDKKEHDYQKNVTKAKLNKKGSMKELCSICGKQNGETTVINAIKTVKLSKTSYTYNGKEKKPIVTVTDSKGRKLKKNTDYKVTYAKACKNPGKYTVTVKFKGNYTGTKKLSYTIKPKAVTLSKLSAKSKGFKVTWKKGTKISGYQIQYSTSSKFTDKKTVTKNISDSRTTSKTIAKLKAKKKYYVRVRTYKTIKTDGKSKKIYSSWSDVKKVTTKK